MMKVKLLKKIANTISDESCLKEFRETLNAISTIIVDINYDVINKLTDIVIEKNKSIV